MIHDTRYTIHDTLYMIHDTRYMMMHDSWYTWYILIRPFLVEEAEKSEMPERGAQMLESKYFDEQLFKNCLVKLSKFEEESLRFSVSDACSHFRKPQVRLQPDLGQQLFSNLILVNQCRTHSNKCNCWKIYMDWVCSIPNLPREEETQKSRTKGLFTPLWLRWEKRMINWWAELL